MRGVYRRPTRPFRQKRWVGSKPPPGGVASVTAKPLFLDLGPFAPTATSGFYNQEGFRFRSLTNQQLLSLPGTADNGLISGDFAGTYNIDSGVLSVRALMRTTDWSPGSPMTAIQIHGQTNNWCALMVNNDGKLLFAYTEDNALVPHLFSDVSIEQWAGGDMWIRADLTQEYTSGGTSPQPETYSNYDLGYESASTPGVEPSSALTEFFIGQQGSWLPVGSQEVEYVEGTSPGAVNLFDGEDPDIRVGYRLDGFPWKGDLMEAYVQHNDATIWHINVTDGQQGWSVGDDVGDTGIDYVAGTTSTISGAATVYNENRNHSRWLHAQDVSALGALHCPATSGGYGTSTPRSAGNVITGDMFIAAHIRPSQVGTYMILSRFQGDGDACFSFGTRDDGALLFTWSPDGTFANTVDVASTVQWFTYLHTFPLQIGEMFWVGVSHDVDNGSGGRDTKFYAARTREELLNHQLGATVTFGTNGTIYDSSTADYWIGARENGGFFFDGGIYDVETYAGLDFQGTKKLGPRFWDYQQGWSYEMAAGETGSDDEGNTWSIGQDHLILSGQDTSTPFDVRILGNATRDPKPVQATLMYKRVDEADSEWRAVV